MAISANQALLKLEIEAFRDRDRKTQIGDRISVLYNPESVNLGFENDYESPAWINKSTTINRFCKPIPTTLSLDLLFDATPQKLRRTGLEPLLEEFRQHCCEIESHTLEPPFVTIYWGKMNWGGQKYFAGRLASMAINYDLFDRNGAPLRATLSAKFLAEQSEALQTGSKGSVLDKVQVMDKPEKVGLDGVSMAALGSSSAYLQIAAANQLTSIRDIKSGTPLVIPSK